MAQALPLAGKTPANGRDARMLLLSRLLMKGVSYLERLRAEGVARTNFMKCDERSIYVFEYLFTTPSKILYADIPALRRSHNHSLLRHLVDLLDRHDESLAATELSSFLPECDPRLVSDQDASTELRILKMIEMHRLIYGILLEVIDKGLSPSLTKCGTMVRDEARLPTECRSGLSYLDRGVFIDFMVAHLVSTGCERAAEIVRNHKGRPIW
jgi:hypothetical protein